MHAVLVCPVCTAEIPAGDPVAFVDDGVLHLDCFLKIRKPPGQAGTSREPREVRRSEPA